MLGPLVQNIKANPHAAHLIALVFATKLLSNTGLRILYPLAPFLQDDWGFSRSEFGLILALSEFAAVLAVFIAPLADKYSVSKVSVASWALMTISFFLLIIDISEVKSSEFNDTTENNQEEEIPSDYGPMFGLVIFARILFVLGYQLFFSTSLSVALGLVSDEKKLGTAAAVESSWGTSALSTIPLLTLLYGGSTFQVTFATIGCVFFILGIDVMASFPNSHLSHEVDRLDFSLYDIVKDLSHLSVWTFNFQALFFSIGHNGVFTIFSFWAEDEFDVSVESIGAAFFIGGVAELLGSAAIFFAPLYMPKKMYILCHVATVFFMLALFALMFADSYGISLFYMFFYFSMGELNIVFTIAETESYVAPEYRSSALALHSTCMFLGRSLGAYVGEKLYSNYGIRSALICFIVSTVVSMVFLWVAEKYKRPQKVIHFKEEKEKSVLRSESPARSSVSSDADKLGDVEVPRDHVKTEGENKVF